MKTKLRISIITAILLVFAVSAVSAKKPFKHAPEKTIVIFFSKPTADFDKDKYPHLDFYYLPQLTHNEADFITRLNAKTTLASPLTQNGGIFSSKGSGKYQSVVTLLLDANKVVAYQRRYVTNALQTGSYFNGDYFLTEPGVKDKRPAIADAMKDYISKGKLAKVSKKKSYTEGQEPAFKAWEKGDIEEMQLPDFDVYNVNSEKTKIYDAINGKPAFIVFHLYDYDSGSWGQFPFLSELENALYGYSPEKKK